MQLQEKAVPPNAACVRQAMLTAPSTTYLSPFSRLAHTRPTGEPCPWPLWHVARTSRSRVAPWVVWPRADAGEPRGDWPRSRPSPLAPTATPTQLPRRRQRAAGPARGVHANRTCDCARSAVIGGTPTKEVQALFLYAFFVLPTPPPIAIVYPSLRSRHGR
ncbi:hypothetical protein BDY21DRAFT_150357 [Lineolata rhizophorae]|uniref:Uncharacterized protein n=1 Tax=Lineolata rhizophorae TaxID=578093 RepID=A0A6A6NMF6_9PEZI|nr:hypothetical protein BDY21DRAFT_150357 [Lineolata rhizophorae]